MGYAIAADGRSITCDRCGMTSHNPNDVDARYCGMCKVFHDDESRWCEGGCGMLIVRINGQRTLPRYCTRCSDYWNLIVSGRP